MYGQGKQKKPIIHLSDVVTSIIKACEGAIDVGHEIMNQTTECLPVCDMAMLCGDHQIYIPNPRVENETHQMVSDDFAFGKMHEVAIKGKSGIHKIWEVKTENEVKLNS